jgi:hypothetical protein
MVCGEALGADLVAYREGVVGLEEVAFADLESRVQPSVKVTS